MNENTDNDLLIIEKKINKLLMKLDKTDDNDKKNKYIERLYNYKSLIKELDFKIKFKELYPENYKKNFIKKLLKKKEFTINKYKVEEKKNDNNLFILSKNQQFLKKLISPNTPYKSLYLFHGVGVGKTCSSIQIADNFRNYYTKPPLIILRRQLRDNFKTELFDITKLDNNNMEQCLGNYYLEKTNLINKENKILANKNIIEKQVKKHIKNDYDFLGYVEFSNIIDRIKESSTSQRALIKLRKIFDNRVIIIDEIHNMRTTGNENLHYMLRHIYNNVLVLLSATPMYDNYKEIKFIFNTLLLNEKKFNELIDENESILNNKQEITVKFSKKIKKISNNYISYMRGEDPNTFPARLYPSINKDNNILKKKNYPNIDMNNGNKILSDEQLKYLELVYTKMSKLQQNLYNLVKTKDEDIDIDIKENPNLQQRVQISNIIYPLKNIYNKKYNIIDENFIDIKNIYGEIGFKNIFNITASNNNFQVEYKDSDNQILDYNNIQLFSPKIKLLLDYIENSEGIVLIHSKYITSGIIPISIALEHIGYNKYFGSNILKNNKNIKKNNKNYIIISGDDTLSGTNKQRSDLIEKTKQFENRNGEMIKVILITDTGTEGLNLKNIREVHIFEPWFNLNKIEQIIGRGVRNKSHHNLEKEKRNTTIYQYVNLNNNNVESIDFRTYRQAENKQVNISNIEKLIKENSIDCNLNINKLNYNNLQKIKIITSKGIEIKEYDINDKPGTRICDYKNKCGLECSTKVTFDNLDESTFNKDILKYDIIYYQKIIKNYFKNENMISLEILKKKLNLDNDEILYFALNDMIENKILFNGLNNRLGYLIYRSNKYIFQPYNIKDEKIIINERHQKKISVPSRINITDLKRSKKIDTKNNDNNIKINYDKIIDNKINEYLKSLKLNDKQKQEYMNYLYDIYVDNLDSKNLLILYENFLNKNINDKNLNFLTQSLEKGLYLFKNNSNEYAVYNYFNKKFMCLNNNNKLENCAYRIQSENEKILKKKLKDINSEIIKNKRINKNLPYGFMENVKNNVKFKIKNINIDNKNEENKLISGTVCSVSTSIFTNEKLISLIKLFDKNNILKMKIKNSKKISSKKLKEVYNFNNRNDLCVIYQIVLRILSDEENIYYFLRPIHNLNKN